MLTSRGIYWHRLLAPARSLRPAFCLNPVLGAREDHVRGEKWDEAKSGTGEKWDAASLSCLQYKLRPSFCPVSAPVSAPLAPTKWTKQRELSSNSGFGEAMNTKFGPSRLRGVGELEIAVHTSGATAN